MWWCRALLLSLALGACGFEPVHTSGGGFYGKVAVAAPETRESYLLVRRLEERIGRTGVAEYELALALEILEQGLAIDAEGDVRRFHLVGRVEYALRALETGEIATSGSVNGFTGFSTTGTTVASLAAERDAHERLMTMLADQIITRLQAASPAP